MHRFCHCGLRRFVRGAVSVDPAELEPLLFQDCCRLKHAVFWTPPPPPSLSPRLGNTPTSTSLKRTQTRNTPFTTEARVVRQTHSVVFTGGPTAVVFVCRRTCVVGKLPCNALTFVQALAQTDFEALATTHLCRLFVHVSVWLNGPWRRHSFKRHQPKNGGASAFVFTLPRVRRRTLSVPQPAPCTPPLQPCGPGDVLHVQTAEL